MKKIKTCPYCSSQNVIVYEKTAYMVNTLEHYCHSIKAHDSDAEVCCLDCDFEGFNHELKEVQK